MTAHRDCSVSAGSDSLTAISAGVLQPTELSGYQSASPDSSGQEQGGVSARLRPAASCAGQRQPRLGLTGEDQSGWLIAIMRTL